MFTLKDAVYVANEMGIMFDKFSIRDLMVGLNIELEHGYVNPVTNITNDNLMMTAKIALAHLMEYPNYYNEEYGLPDMEKNLMLKLKKEEL